MKKKIKKNIPYYLYLLILFIFMITFFNYLFAKNRFIYNAPTSISLSQDNISNSCLKYSFKNKTTSIGGLSFNINNLPTEVETITLRLLSSNSANLYGEWTFPAESLADNSTQQVYLDTPLKNTYNNSYIIELKPQSLQSIINANSTFDYSVLSLKVSTKYYIAFFIILILLMISLFFCLHAKKESTILLTLFLSLGLCYFIFVPIFQVNDEYGHFIRGYEITQGYLITPKSETSSGVSHLPQNMYPEKLSTYSENKYYKIYNSLNVTLDKNNIVDYDNPAQCMYSFLSYLPQSIGMGIADLFTDRTVVIFYSARLFNYIASCFLLLLAIRLIPFGKRSIILIISTPMFMQVMISCSSDTFINALSIFITAYILKLSLCKEIITKHQMLFLGIICFLIAMCKVVYLPLCFLILLIPKTNFKNKKTCFLYKTCVICLSTISNLLWLAFSASYLTEIRPGVNSSEQVKYMLTHIFTYIQILFNTIYEQGLDWINRLIGSNLSWYDIEINKFLILTFLIVIILDSILISNEDLKLCTKHGIYFFIISIFILGLSLSALYVQWTPLRSTVVEGFQGRYIIPIFLMSLLLMKRIPFKQKSNLDLLKIELPFIYFINVNALLTIFLFNIA